MCASENRLEKLTSARGKRLIMPIVNKYAQHHNLEKLNQAHHTVNRLPGLRETSEDIGSNPTPSR